MYTVIDAQTEEEIGELDWSDDVDQLLKDLANGDYIPHADGYRITPGLDDDKHVYRGRKLILILSEEPDTDFEDDEEDDFDPEDFDHEDDE
jgi:hypothetical protein